MTGRPLLPRILLCLGLLALLCGASDAIAANGTTRPGRAGGGAGAGAQDHPMMQKVREAIDSLDLTADQKKQIDQIFQETREDIRGMAKDLKGMTPDQRREKLKPVIQDMIEKIKSVLTDPQKAALKTKLEALRKEREQAGDKKPSADVVPPATQPIGDAAAPHGPMMQRIHDRLAKLDLSPEQQTKVDAILDDTGKKFQALRQQAQDNAGDTRQKSMSLMQSTRQQIAAVLTPEQQQQWRESQGPAPSPPAADSARPDAPKVDAPKAAAMNDSTTGTTGTTVAKAAAVSSSASPAVESKTKSLYEGADAPPFRLRRLSGSDVTLDSFVGKPLVLIFGSFTSPTFRDKVSQIDELSKRYRGRAAFLIVYTKEAYPVNEWEVQRNLTEQIKVDQHQSLDERVKMAKLTQDGLKIQTDIAVDDIDDAVADAYDAMPNGAYVIASGKIIFRQKWADPLGLPAWIDIALKKTK